MMRDAMDTDHGDIFGLGEGLLSTEANVLFVRKERIERQC